MLTGKTRAPVFILNLKILSEKSRLLSVVWKMSSIMKPCVMSNSFIIPDIFQIVDESLDFEERIFLPNNIFTLVKMTDGIYKAVPI